ncbi:protein kinase domain-containing protein [Pseudanabaena mucicola]|uniref:non-specific serine/threonine protein kinase n=1 Tax=Pseudanabaena mucicola FACHB-723 TaxID=2692860 RepID=A0ABR7ZZR1_9CYAN|nr:protein kinase [Pseudanabaena mucicola]MBD2188985.1 protein kinase [Pseudanabaena mucicola FACHB-723]
MLNTTLRGHYKIVSHLGGGGFGQTYLAQDIDLPTQPTCVVKQLKPISSEPFVLETAKRLFDQEAEILYALGNHDRIPRLLAHFQEGNEFYLVQEFADGSDLSKEIGTGKHLPESTVLTLLKELLEILVFVHGQGVVHRDIKPANLIRRKSDQKIVLIDFGAVKEIGGLAGDSQGNTNLTIAIGSPGYMPTEQLNGKPRFSSDIYAVGMMGIQAITGAEPRRFHEHPETAELLWRDLVPQGVYSAKFLDILDKMVRYDFRQRYQTAQQVLAAIATIAQDNDLPTVINANNTVSNLETVVVSPQSPDVYLQKEHPSQLHTIPFQSVATRRLPLWLWIAGSSALILLIISFVFAKFSNKSPITEVTSSPTATTPSISPITTPSSSPTPTPTVAPTPLSVEELLAQALVLNRNNKPQEALAKVEEALKIDPTNPKIWGAKGLLLRRLGREEEAIAAFAKAVELSPQEQIAPTEQTAPTEQIAPTEPVITPPRLRDPPSKKGKKK